MKRKVPRVAIYSGGIPSTTFIERLVLGLAKKDIEVYLFGKRKAPTDYPPNIKVVANGDVLSQIGIVLKFGLLLLISNPRIFIAVNKHCRQLARSKWKYFDLLVKYLPVAYYKPDIFHLQWANFINEWMWVKDIDMKLLLSLRGSHINYSAVIDPNLAETYKRTFKNIDAFHAVSNAICRKAMDYNAHSIKTIYSGLALDEYPIIKQNKPSSNKIEIISVGRWHWVKGYGYAIDAMKILTDNGLDFHYTIIAGKPPQDVIYNIADMGLTHTVTILDQLPHEEVMKRIQSSDILLLPSLDEGIANVVLEAMAVGTIVLSTDCGGMKEVINDGMNGFLVGRRDSAGIADKIMVISKLTEDEKEDVRKNARKKIEEQHNIDAMIDGMYDLYKSVMTDDFR